MRLLNTRKVQKYEARRRQIIEDEEGGQREGYGAPFEVVAYVYHASGQVQAELYGSRLTYIKNVIANEDYGLNELDVIVIDQKPHRIISIKRYTGHVEMAVEEWPQ